MSSPPVVDPANFIDGRRMGGYQRQIVMLCVMIGLIDGYDALSFGYAVPAISRDWGIDPSAITPAATAGVFGLIVGGITLGSLADRRGRRPVVITGMAIFAAFTGAIALAPNIATMSVFRFLAGVGLGAVAPTIIALAIEYTPRRSKATVAVVVAATIPAGGFLGGLLINAVVPRDGWQVIFLIGGIIPLLILPAAIKWLPESLALLAIRGQHDKLRATLHRLDSSIGEVRLAAPQVEVEAVRKAPIRELFEASRYQSTMLLWIAHFCGYMLYFVLVTWMPTLLVGSGMDQSLAIWATTCLTLGSMTGTVVLGLIIDKRKQDYRVMLLGFPLGAFAIVGLVLAVPNPVLALPLSLLLGLAALGTLSATTAVAGAIYPASARATGISWAVSLGRVGAVLGPLVVGILLAMDLSPTTIFLAAVVPTAVAALAMTGLVRALQRQGAEAHATTPTASPSTADSFTN